MYFKILLCFVGLGFMPACINESTSHSRKVLHQQVDAQPSIPAPMPVKQNWQTALKEILVHDFTHTSDQGILTLELNNPLPMESAAFRNLMVRLATSLTSTDFPHSVVLIEARGVNETWLKATLYLKDARAFATAEISEPEFLRRMEVQVVETVATLSMRAFAKRAEGLQEEALQAVNAWLEKTPRQIEALWLLANILRDQKNYWESLRVTKLILQLDPQHRAALQNLGTLLFQIGDIKTSIEAYSRLLALEPTNFGYLKSLIQVRAQDKDLNGTLVLLAQARALQPDPELDLIEGNLYRDLKKIPQASARYSAGYQASPSDHRFLFNLLLLDLDAKRLDAAKKKYADLLIKSPELARELSDLDFLRAEEGGE